MCFESPFLRVRKTNGRGQESGDKSSGRGRAGYRKQDVLAPFPHPTRNATCFEMCCSCSCLVLWFINIQFLILSWFLLTVFLQRLTVHKKIVMATAWVYHKIEKRDDLIERAHRLITQDGVRNQIFQTSSQYPENFVCTPHGFFVGKNRQRHSASGIEKVRLTLLKRI